MAGVYKTIQDRIEKWIEANNPETYRELMLNVHKIIHEEIFEDLDERLYGFNPFNGILWHLENYFVGK